MSESRLIFDDKERVGAWVADQVGQAATWGSFYAMGAEVDGELVAGIVFNNFNDSSATSHFAVSKPTKLFIQLLDHCYAYAFEKNGLLRLTGLINADNWKSLRLSTHIGFEPESVMRKAGNGGTDIIVLALWPWNYRKGKRHEQR